MPKFFAVLATALAVAALNGWVFMLTVGVVHAEWIPALPTIGFGPAVLVATLLGVTAALISVSTRRSE